MVENIGSSFLYLSSWESPSILGRLSFVDIFLEWETSKNLDSLRISESKDKI